MVQTKITNQMVKCQIGGSFCLNNYNFNSQERTMKMLDKFNYMPGNGNGQDDDPKPD